MASFYIIILYHFLRRIARAMAYFCGGNILFYVDELQKFTKKCCIYLDISNEGVYNVIGCERASKTLSAAVRKIASGIPSERHDKGKPCESAGRKAMGSTAKAKTARPPVFRFLLFI